MDVHGINWESFMIFIDPHETGMSTHQPQCPIHNDNHTYTLGTSGHHIQGPCTEIEDFNPLYQEVAKIGDWDGLCSNLGVNEAKMNELRYSSGSYVEKKRGCLQAYFDTGEAFWEDVVKAVIKHPIDNKRVAIKIVEQHELRRELLDKSHGTFLCNVD